MFKKDVYSSRRYLLQKNISSGIVVLLGNTESPINFEHNTYPFRQDSTFLYYVGIASPKLALIIDIEEDKTILFGNEMTIDDIVWMGRLETLQEKAQMADVDQVLPFGELSSYIARAKSSQRNIHFLPPYQSHNKILLEELLHISFQQLLPSTELIKAVVAQRSIKEDIEIAEIEKAIHISAEMHLLAMQMARPGMKEYEIVNAIQGLAAGNNCPLAYAPIVTVHGEILHNAYRQNTLTSGDLVLNDSGAETPLGYAGDLTRTFPVDRSFTDRQREMYNIVLSSFTDARDMLRPGIKFKDVHLRAATSLVEGLVAIGLMKGNPQEAVANHAHTMFFQCGLGHMMGLDVHDMEDLGEQFVGYTADEPKDTKTFGLKSLRLGKALEPGNVLTVEPGIYIIPELIDRWKAEKKNADFINYDKLEEYRNFGGIRIEDDFLITGDGYRLLGPELIKTVQEIENYRANYA